jgi:hypothetical protein
MNFKGGSPMVRDAIVLIAYLLKHTTYNKMTDISRALGIPLIRLYYLTTPVYEVRHTEEAMLMLRKYAPKRYARILNNMTRVKDGYYYTNASIYHILYGVALHMGYILRFVGKRGYRVVLSKAPVAYIQAGHEALINGLDKEELYT